MIRPELFWITVAILVAALIFRPKNPWARFLVRQIVTMAAIALWGCNAGFSLGYWGFEGSFFGVFFLCIAPLIVALHPQKVWISLPLVSIAFLSVAGLTIHQMTREAQVGQIAPAMLAVAKLYAWGALPGTFLVWQLLRGGHHQIERWEREWKARKK